MSKSPYNYRWQKARKTFLRRNPLCAYCHKLGIVKPSNVVDHITPHKGNQSLFWDTGNWQPLCDKCHNSTKKQQEIRGYATGFDLDGWPMDAMHPVNKG